MKKARWSRTSSNGSPRLFLLTAIEKAIAHNQRLQVKLSQASVEDDKDREWTDKDNLHEASEASYRHTFQASTLDRNTKVGEQQAIALKRLESLDRYIRHLQIRNAKQATESNYENEDEQSAMNSNYTQYETKNKAAKSHLKEMSRKIKESQKILERQDALMTQLSICQDQIEKEIKKVAGPAKKLDFIGGDKISFRKLANLSFGTSDKGKRLAQMSVDHQVGRDMSLSTLLEDEGIKSNATCSEIRSLVKRQVEALKAEDLKLIGDDTTLVRMINFFAEYKKKHEEWRKKQDRKDKNKLIAQMVSDERDKDDISRREMNLHKIKLKPFYKSELGEEDQDTLDRLEQEKIKRGASIRESSISNRLNKDVNIIRDRSVRGNDRYYEPDLPENVLFVDDASLAGDPSVAGSKYYLTEGNRSVSGKRKVTLNLKIPKSKLANLKNIRALIRTRDPKTHALMTKERTFTLDKIDESTAESKPQKKYRFKSNNESGKGSVHEKSTDLTSQIPSIAGDSKFKAPLRIEKMEFSRPNHLPNLSGSKDYGNGTLDKRKGMFFVFIGDPKNEFVG